MTPSELAQKIETQTETPNLDFKADCPWDDKKFAKDFLAMTNMRDGGLIVIGVEEKDGAFIPTGITEANLKTFQVDIMKDQLLKYADPSIDFQINYPEDVTGKKYVVIQIFSFRELPVLSKKDLPGEELRSNTIYYRNTNKRVESAPISNPNDMRNLIELAAIRLVQKRKSFGYTFENSHISQLDKELTLLPTNGIIRTIRSKGYWEIRFRPLQGEVIKSLKDGIEIVRRSQINIGGWDFPQIPIRDNDFENLRPADGANEAKFEYGARKEYWRLYKSEQFICLLALIEDWYEGDLLRGDLAHRIPSGRVINLYQSIVYLITQTIEFLSRLAFNGLYKEGTEINIILHNSKDRRLYMDDPQRAGFIYDRISGSKLISVTRITSNQELLLDARSISKEFILEVLDNFGFNPDPTIIDNVQDQLLTGKI